LVETEEDLSKTEKAFGGFQLNSGACPASRFSRHVYTKLMFCWIWVNHLMINH
jgi:hypothetical protein